MSRREELPWHKATGGHVYIYAGGTLMRRLTRFDYRRLVNGGLVDSQWLSLDVAPKERDEFESAVIEYETQQMRKEYEKAAINPGRSLHRFV